MLRQDTSILGKIAVKLTIEYSNVKLLWPPQEFVKEEDNIVSFSDGSTFGLEEAKSVHGREVFEVSHNLKERDFINTFPDFLDRQLIKAFTIQVSRHVPRYRSHLSDRNTALLRYWLEEFTVGGHPPGAHTIRVRGDLDKWALVDFLRSQRSNGLHVIQTDGGNGRASYIPGHYLQEVVEALEASNTSLTVFCEFLDDKHPIDRTVYSWPRSHKTIPAHGDNCRCWKTINHSQGRTRIVRRLDQVLERNKKLHGRVQKVVADVLVPARVLLYATNKKVAMQWKWNWRWSAGLWDDRQWVATRAPPKVAQPSDSLLTKLPAEIIERILELTTAAPDDLTPEQWRGLLNCVRDRDAFRSQSRATPGYDGHSPEFAVTMDEWMHNGKLWWDRGVPPAETHQAKRRKLAGGDSQ
ncbi:hypothetical protein Q8F55_002968 [Vanrija albida]|uniref:F-box domain-containing protein n=1 Tax=Vanrija albida TaxID=181172 RepID=A0ABR3QB61_9TREE